MKASRLALAFGLGAALGLTSRAVRAQGDQSNIISQQGDALSRSTSAEALVEPKPTRPPNSAPPVVPSTEPEPGKGRAVLIVIGALIALAMFLWERRRKD